jgi:hypothetical protein
VILVHAISCLVFFLTSRFVRNSGTGLERSALYEV